MTVPRRVVPGAIYLVTRRCAQRQFLLKPSPLANDVFLYLLALAAQRFEILVHAFCVMSNHYHLVVTDPKARLPAFHQLLDALVARALNAALGRCESFWAPNSYSAVTLVSPEDIADKTAYVLANPVAAGLVRSGRLWPGLWSAPEAIGGEPLDVRRPGHFFDPAGSLPEKLTLQLTPPPGFASAEVFREQLSACLVQREAQAARDVGGSFLGVAGVLRQKASGRPSRGEARGRLSPRIAAHDKWKRFEALGRLMDFLRSYRSAWQARCDGDAAVFPYGTYLLRVVHGVPCEGFG